jgi:hypothetical protein
MFDQAKQICITLLLPKKTITTNDINDTIEKVFTILPEVRKDRELLYKFLEAQFSIFSEDYKILEDKSTFKPWLKQSKAQIKWNYWNRYVKFLQNKIAPDTLNLQDNLTDDILDRLINPRTEGSWDKRGMVVGQVQSGKTGNYIGLINKAADAGFRLIIVLAGMHDSLRSQTQIRIDEGFLGFNTQTAMNFSNAGNRIGVGVYNKDLPAHSLTTSHLNGDFKKQVALASGINIRGTDPIILVIKKNGSILKNLIGWLSVRGEKMLDGKIIIRDLPLLLIDDEADNASINVNPQAVSTINGSIRALLSLFDQSAYIGYTATPFANIFIPLLAEEQTKGIDITISNYEFTVGQDLFPSDFIINIPAPSNYIGPEKLFGLPFSQYSEEIEDPLPIIVPIADFEKNINSPSDEKYFIPNKHKKDDQLPTELPPSLKYAIKCFILSCAARKIRRKVFDHNSMLIHVSRYIRWQDRIASLADKELKFYQRQIEFNQGTILKELKIIWEKNYLPITNEIMTNSRIFVDPEIKQIEWSEIESELHNAASMIEVRAVHGDKNIAGLTYHNISPLDYFLAKEQGQTLSVIAVGGDKLSRGLTLEGLSISYYLRASKMYDTLMQMGRWFGYRPGYTDLCRLFTSDELIKWYKHITIASDEIRKEFDYMFLLNRTPRDYGLKIRTHPDVLKITAANKFRHKQIMQLSFSGELKQTYSFKRDEETFRSNYETTMDLIRILGPTTPIKNRKSNQKILWYKKNNYQILINYLNNFIIKREVLDLGKLVDYINAQIKHGNLVNWTFVLIDKGLAEEGKKWDFQIDGKVSSIGLTNRGNLDKYSDAYTIAKAMILDPAHESIDLTDDQIEIALDQTTFDWTKVNKNKIPERPSGFRIRKQRAPSEGLIILYPLAGVQFNRNIVKEETISDRPIFGFAISFPEIENDEKIEYAVNQQFISEFDYPDELDLEGDDYGQN